MIKFEFLKGSIWLTKRVTVRLREVRVLLFQLRVQSFPFPVVRLPVVLVLLRLEVLLLLRAHLQCLVECERVDLLENRLKGN